MHETKVLKPPIQKLLCNAPVVYFAVLLISTAFSWYLWRNNYDIIVTNATAWFLLGLVPQVLLAGVCMIRFREHTRLSAVLS